MVTARLTLATTFAVVMLLQQAVAAPGDQITIQVPTLKMTGLSQQTLEQEQAQAEAEANAAAAEYEARKGRSVTINAPTLKMTALSQQTLEQEQAQAQTEAEAAAAEYEARKGRAVTINAPTLKMTGTYTPEPEALKPIAPVGVIPKGMAVSPPSTSASAAGVKTAPQLAAAGARTKDIAPDISISTIKLNRNCEPIVTLRNSGTVPLPKEAYKRGARPSLQISAGRDHARWPLTRFDPKRRLLKPGGSLKWRWPKRLKGEVQVTAIFDQEQRMAERNRANNRQTQSLRCSPPAVKQRSPSGTDKLQQPRTTQSLPKPVLPLR